MRKLLFKLHLIVALVFGLFILLLGVTGSIMAFEQEIQHWQHRSLEEVHPNGTPMTLAQITAVVEKVYPGDPVEAYLPPSSPTSSVGVALQRELVFVNPYNGLVLGELPNGLDALGDIHQLHLRLAMLDKGAHFGETTIKASGVAALFLVITGAYLWWPTKRVSIGGGPGSRRFWFDVHNTFGILSFVFVLILVVTGLVIGFDEQTTPILYRLTNSQPPPQLRLEATPIAGKDPITPDQALEIARAAAPGAAPILITAARGKNVYRISARYPEDLTPGGRTRIAVDPYSGKVLLLIDSRTGPAGYRLVNLNRAIHTGDIFGLPSKVVMSVASLVMALQLVSGVVMWLKRRGAEKKATARSRPQVSSVTP